MLLGLMEIWKGRRDEGVYTILTALNAIEEGDHWNS